MSSRGLSSQTNHQAWRLAALAIIVCFATTIVVRNNAGAALSVVAMTIVALVADVLRA